MVVLKRLKRQMMLGIMGAFDDGGFSDWKEAKEKRILGACKLGQLILELQDIRGRDQEEDEGLLQDGQDEGVRHSEREEARPRRNMPAMVNTSFLKFAEKPFIVQVPPKL